MHMPCENNRVWIWINRFGSTDLDQPIRISHFSDLSEASTFLEASKHSHHSYLSRGRGEGGGGTGKGEESEGLHGVVMYLSINVSLTR